MPANIAVICIIRNTAKVIPINSAENLALSFTSSLNPIRRMPLYFMAPRLCPPELPLHDRKLFIAFVIESVVTFGRYCCPM